ncbi:unnamed protein product [Boreogadus saida]
MATTLKLIGGQGGRSFSFTGRDNGATLKKIGVAVGGRQIKAVRAELTDGRVQTFGKGDSFSEFTFGIGERITRLSLWGNGAGTRLGGIRFWTSSGRQFFKYMSDWGLQTEYSIDVGSGVCLGLEGRAGSDIDNMGFLFINAIKSSELTDLHYPTLAVYTPQIKKEYIKSLIYQNDTTADQEHKLTYSRSVTKSTTWSTTTKIESTVSLSVTAGFPGLAEVSGGFSVTFGAQKTSSMTTEETIIESDEVNVTVPAGKAVRVVVSVGRAVIDLPYSATVKIRCLNGSELRFHTTGRYIAVAYTAVNFMFMPEPSMLHMGARLGFWNLEIGLRLFEVKRSISAEPDVNHGYLTAVLIFLRSAQGEALVLLFLWLVPAGMFGFQSDGLCFPPWKVLSALKGEAERLGTGGLWCQDGPETEAGDQGPAAPDERVTITKLI